MKKIAVIMGSMAILALAACGEYQPSSDEVQRAEQEKLLAEGTAETGMPAIKNFRERKIMKDILEMRDQEGLITYTYFENMTPVKVPGSTSLGGKLTFYCVSVGYPISAAMQYTNPEKIARESTYGIAVLPQADPNGMFSPSSSEGSWVMCKDPNGDDVKPFYSEPRLVTSPWKLKAD
jgi:hypothetical protein